jgi:demethylmenaquinone methyltransferase/2-methoxy-6-polyprenyl-1,4-benzoquinol methylase
MLHLGGKIFFADSRRRPSASSTPNQREGQTSQIVTRTLNDGRAFEIVKNRYDATDLVARCARAGLDISVHQTATYFLYGFGTRLAREKHSENLPGR